MTKTVLNKKINSILKIDYPLCSFSEIKLFLYALSVSYQPKIITVGGTNGKGSTVAILERLFKFNKINCVSYTSPHLLQFNERIKFNGILISNQSLIPILIEIEKIVYQIKLGLNYYQISFLCACVYMHHKAPAWFILEVGIGGRLDPANQFDSDISILTCIGLDHTEVLGDNIESIGLEKSHIARSNKPIILGSAMPISVYNYLKQINANIIKANMPSLYHCTHLPKQSVACALSTALCITPPLKIDPNISSLQVPGRIQILQRNPMIIVDVGHNPDAVSYLFEKLIKYKKFYKRCIGIFGANATKDAKSMINIAKSHINEWLIPDLHRINNGFLTLNAIQLLLPEKNSKYFNNLIDLVKQLRMVIKNEDLVIIFGSFILVAEWIRLHEKSPLLY